MSLLKLQVDELTRKLIDNNVVPVFVEGDTNVNKVRFSIPSGFSDFELTEETVFRVMYVRPGADSAVMSKVLDFVKNDGLYFYYDWPMASSLFREPGILSIALCILNNAEEVQGWHTIPYKINIAPTIHITLEDDS